MTKRRESLREKKAEKAVLEKELASIQNRNGDGHDRGHGIGNVEEWKRVAEFAQAQ